MPLTIGKEELSSTTISGGKTVETEITETTLCTETGASKTTRGKGSGFITGRLGGWFSRGGGGQFVAWQSSSIRSWRRFDAFPSHRFCVIRYYQWNEDVLRLKCHLRTRWSGHR